MKPGQVEEILVHPGVASTDATDYAQDSKRVVNSVDRRARSGGGHDPFEGVAFPVHLPAGRVGDGAIRVKARILRPESLAHVLYWWRRLPGLHPDH